MKSRLVNYLFAIVTLYLVFIANQQYKQRFFVYDKSGYYLFLPAVFLYNDLSHLNFYPQIDEKYRPSKDAKWFVIYEMPDGKRLNRYTFGTAILEMPFFLAMQVYANNQHEFETDGYSQPYVIAVMLSNIFWVIVGLFFIRKLLKKYYSDGIVALALLCIGFGTNIYCYTVYDLGMSHPYSFMLMSWLLLLTHNWYASYSKKYMYGIGFALGLIILTRPVNIIAIIIPLYGRFIACRV